jgi:hypothetical protein
MEYSMGILVARSTSGAGGTGSSSNLILYAENPVGPIVPTALGVNSVAIGSGANTSISGTNSIAIGEQSVARLPNSMMLAGGRFASSGDAQVGKYLLRSHTTNSVETELFIDGTNGTESLILPDDSTWTFKGMVTGHRTDNTDGHAGFVFSGVIYRVAGAASVSFQGRPSIEVIARNNFLWGVKLHANPINGSLQITCIGQTGKTIRWVATVDTVEVTN